MMDVETISAEAEGRDIPIDYSSAGGGTRDSDKLSYEVTFAVLLDS